MTDIRLGDYLNQIDQIIPLNFAESWDKVGLLIGDPDSIVTAIVLTLDITEKTIELAEANQANLIIAHHPIIFSPIGSLREDNAEQSLIRTLIHKDIAVIALHTNLDAVSGGTADSLADALELSEISRFVFAPLVNRPEYGHGRVLELTDPLQLIDLKKLTAQRLQSSGVRINTDRDLAVQRIAVFPGSFDESWITQLNEFEIDAIITGELKHHVGLMLAARNIAALDTGHDVSERVVLPRLLHQLHALAPDLAFAVDFGFDYNKMTF
ncbi:MAG: Nif3-like dinuclear metal center hexameric protein [Eubacteriales bacterium]|nr:Nif3-like dinuclear metal center hexameric protein [Eubacteriales bacterium]